MSPSHTARMSAYDLTSAKRPESRERGCRSDEFRPPRSKRSCRAGPYCSESHGSLYRPWRTAREIPQRSDGDRCPGRFFFFFFLDALVRSACERTVRLSRRWIRPSRRACRVRFNDGGDLKLTIEGPEHRLSVSYRGSDAATECRNRASQAAKTSPSDKERHSLTVTSRILRQRAGRKQIPPSIGTAPVHRPARWATALLKASVRAHRWRECWRRGYHVSSGVGPSEKVNDSYLSRVLRLGTYSPQKDCGIALADNLQTLPGR